MWISLETIQNTKIAINLINITYFGKNEEDKAVFISKDGNVTSLESFESIVNTLKNSGLKILEVMAQKHPHESNPK
jgi:biopolymer transport protein ExbD